MGYIHIKKSSILIGLVLIILLTTSIQADAIPDSGVIDNGEVEYEWEFFMTTGDASLTISNIGTTPITQFDLYIAELIEYETDPDFWELDPESGSGIFSISGGTLRDDDSFLIEYMFNKDLVELAYSNLDYTDDGDITRTLSNIVTLALLAIDNDEDGFTDDVDCDDDNDSIYPGAPEVCNGIDDNCDEQDDETFDVGDACDNGQNGVCNIAGIKVCDGLYGTMCNAPDGSGNAVQEICDNLLDDDCDGNTDAADSECVCIPNDTRNCGTDIGECSFGTETCIDGFAWGTCVGGQGPILEVCDGLDNNCDGSIDENFICLSQDPIAYYPFDSDYNDYSGNSFDGVPNGDVYIDPAEGINGAAVFDGNGDFIDISRALNTKSFSISGWVQSDSLHTYESIFDIGNEDNHIGITKDRPGFFFGWGSISTTQPIDDQWNYITWTYDEIGNHWKVYVDGEHFAHVSGTWGGLDAPVGTGSQYWGAFYNGILSKYFSGKLDEMTIHNRVLSEQEILDLCISGGRPGCFNTVEISEGWNLLSIPIIPTTNDEDRTISLKAGWNMFGHLSQNPFLWSDAKVSDGSTTKTISEAEAAGWLQETIYYFDEGEQIYKFIPGDEDSLTVNKGYWLYAVKDNLELIFPNVGGASVDNSYNWLDAEVIKGTETKTIEEAQAAGWLQGTIYYFDEGSQTYKFVPGDDDNVYPDRGYWLYSKEDLSLIIS
jgi:hypothetical protein